jgi:dUTP pyrophosphatase
MDGIAKFEKVSFEQYKKDFESISSMDKVILPNDEVLREVYDNIRLPQRATSGSAGYDFFIPFEMIILPENKYVFPTGIRCKMDKGWVLSMYPRSGLGFKYGVRLSNTVGVIDSDYYHSSNEGHIMVSIETGSDDLYFGRDKGNLIGLKYGSAICQGIFTQYGLTVDDAPAIEKRDGGFGSTDKQKK